MYDSYSAITLRLRCLLQRLKRITQKKNVTFRKKSVLKESELLKRSEVSENDFFVNAYKLTADELKSKEKTLKQNFTEDEVNEI